MKQLRMMMRVCAHLLLVTTVVRLQKSLRLPVKTSLDKEGSEEDQARTFLMNMMQGRLKMRHQVCTNHLILNLIQRQALLRHITLTQTQEL